MRISFRSLLNITTLAIAIALAGCNWFDKQSPTEPSPPQPPAPDADVFYTALGASDALGVGGTRLCIPYAACPDGTGYVAVIARRLGVGRKVTLTNLGIPAAVLSPRLQALGLQHGRSIPGNFIDGEMRFVPRESTVITIVTGANDTNTIGTAIERGAAGTDLNGYISGQVSQFSDELTTLVQGVRERAPSARVVIANLPNMAGMPFAAGHTVDRRRVLQQISVAISITAINRWAAQGLPVVDLLCEPRSYQTSLYSSDGFHPNDEGYAVLADQMYAAITTAGYAAPRTTCPQMTLVP